MIHLKSVWFSSVCRFSSYLSAPDYDQRARFVYIQFLRFMTQGMVYLNEWPTCTWKECLFFCCCFQWLWISTRSGWLAGVFWSILWLIFSSAVITERRVLKSPTTEFVCFSFQVCQFLMYFEDLLFDVYI